jgi:hypothetical protein
MDELKFETLKGQLLTKIEGGKDTDELIFFLENGKKLKMHHISDCCESVFIEDICGELDWLIGSPILLAEERDGERDKLSEYDESYTWTFYEIATIKGAVTIRWYGTSNGYYSESVDLDWI